ncbi:MAG: thioredoxin family protein [Deltaproteobacteria bacterium]|nr:thioredoxin family protein [Deltaproteobacteria bacterium]
MTRRLVLAIAVAVLLPVLPILLRLQLFNGASDGKGVLAGGASFATFAFFYVAGVLTSLTPCVYPLIPITVSVFGARKAESKAKSAALSATYVGGIAVTFSTLGLVAALSGKAFGTALASPWVAGGMAVFMLVFAASMFGAFEIDLPQSVKQRLQTVSGAGYASAFGMGLAAGIIAAPCTGPALAGLLTFITQTQNAALGFWLLFTYAIGMGTLFFILGVTSLKLPKSGAWMEIVKSVMGVALLASGLSLLLRFLPKAPMLPVGELWIGLAAGVVGGLAVLFGALSLSFHGDTQERTRKALTLAALTAVIGLQFGWFGAPKAKKINWLHDEAAAVAQSQATGKKILIDFYADWCAACQELDVHTFSDPEVQREVADNFVPLKVDATDTTDEVERLTSKYAVPGLPTVLMVACNEPKPKPEAQCAVPGEGPLRLTGFEPPDKLLARLRRIQ